MKSSAELEFNKYNALEIVPGVNNVGELGRIASDADAISIVPDKEDPSREWIEFSYNDGSVLGILRYMNKQGFWVLDKAEIKKGLAWKTT